MTSSGARRFPIVATLVVSAAVALMIRLGVWQIERLHEKEAALARYAANEARPPVALAAVWPVAEASLFRRVGADCLQPTGWAIEGGRAADGSSGWRHIALCRTGAEGPGIAVDVGVSDANKVPAWRGGPVRGRLTWRPDHQPLIARIIGGSPPPDPMIVAETPAPGLKPSAQPDPASVPNNHLGYAVQWFAFAAVALVIYAIALWRRRV